MIQSTNLKSPQFTPKESIRQYLSADSKIFSSVAEWASTALTLASGDLPAGMEYNNHLQIDPQMQQTASGGLQHQRQSAQGKGSNKYFIANNTFIFPLSNVWSNFYGCDSLLRRWLVESYTVIFVIYLCLDLCILYNVLLMVIKLYDAPHIDLWHLFYHLI